MIKRSEIALNTTIAFSESDLSTIYHDTEENSRICGNLFAMSDYAWINAHTTAKWGEFVGQASIQNISCGSKLEFEKTYLKDLQSRAVADLLESINKAYKEFRKHKFPISVEG